MADKIDCEILLDGTLRWQSGKISAKNHQLFDEFMEQLDDIIGEVKSTEKLKHSHVHVNEEQKLHQH